MQFVAVKHELYFLQHIYLRTYVKSSNFAA